MNSREIADHFKHETGKVPSGGTKSKVIPRGMIQHVENIARTTVVNAIRKRISPTVIRRRPITVK